MKLRTNFPAHAVLPAQINRLQQLLVKEKDLFEDVADHIADHSLRLTIRSLAQQNKQYASELSSYLQSTRSTQPSARAPQKTSTTTLPDETTALAFCSSNERKIVAAYRKLLKETVLYEGLKNIIGYQLSGSLSSMVQLQLLTAVRRRQKHVAAAL
ncbi:MAG TPA: hypothetical protein VL307_00830 [Chitinophagaceae bacterium]|nr:hypothetical protein [Chitinophagaceae bacterium]